ncbi:MAG TPA: class I adenylate-forming enzyme family protein [Thermoanaerobaculia bacterium]
MSLFGALADGARRQPRRQALRRNDESVDLGELLARVEARADALEARGDGGLIALDAADPIDLAVGFFASRRAGRTAVVHAEGVPPLLRQERERRLRGLLPARSDETIFFSSGSVSRGKAIPLSEDRILFSALAYPERVGLRAEDRVAVAVPAGQIFGFVRGIVNSLLVGAESIFFAPRRDALAEADAKGASFALLPPAHLALASGAEGRLRLRGALTAGGPLAEAAAARIESARGVAVRFGYGLTETTALASRQHFDRPRRAGSSGPPAPGLTITVAGAGGDVAPGESGEIRIAGRSVFRGYADPAEPPPFDESGRLRTGDLGFFDEAGEIHVRGRISESIQSHGRFLCAEEVEEAVLEKGGVREAAAVPLGDAFGLLLSTEDGSERFLEEVRAHVSERLPLFARPRRLRRAREIPRTPSGKLDRRAAAKWFES